MIPGTGPALYAMASVCLSVSLSSDLVFCLDFCCLPLRGIFCVKTFIVHGIAGPYAIHTQWILKYCKPKSQKLQCNINKFYFRFAGKTCIYIDPCRCRRTCGEYLVFLTLLCLYNMQLLVSWEK